MPRTLLQIKREMEKLTKEAERIRASEVAGVIQRIKTAIDFYGLTAKDLFGKAPVAKRSAAGTSKNVSKKKRPSPPKYKDKETGKTWTGHGMRPGWFKKAVESGMKPEDMAL